MGFDWFEKFKTTLEMIRALCGQPLKINGKKIVSFSHPRRTAVKRFALAA